MSARKGTSPRGSRDGKRVQESVSLPAGVDGARSETLTQLNRIAENVSGILYQFLRKKDGSYGCPFVSDSVRAMGLDPREIMDDASRIFDLIHSEDLPGMFSSIEESARGLADWRWQGRLVIGGKTAWYRGASRPRKLKNGDILWDGLMLDVTDEVRLQEKKRKAEEAMVQSEARYRNIVERAVEGIFQTAPDGTFISANAALARMTGYGSVKELLEDAGNSVTCFYADPADRVRHLDLLETEGLAMNFEFPARRKDGSVFWVSANTRAVKGPDGTTAFYEGRVEDITARKRVEQELEAYKDNLERVVEKRTAELRDSERELRQKTRYLEEANIALRVLLAQREKDTREMQEAVLNNVREFVLPQVEKLRLLLPDDGQRMCLEVIGKNLETVVSPYINILKKMDKRLTPQEIQVSNLVRQGHSTKTIAELMNLSTRTVDCHRANIRKKLGIHNRKINLRVRLSTLDG